MLLKQDTQVCCMQTLDVQSALVAQLWVSLHLGHPILDGKGNPLLSRNVAPHVVSVLSPVIVPSVHEAQVRVLLSK
jgi:hypothetical protein